jgi:hypothetical protein
VQPKNKKNKHNVFVNIWVAVPTSLIYMQGANWYSQAYRQGSKEPLGEPVMHPYSLEDVIKWSPEKLKG